MAEPQMIVHQTSAGQKSWLSAYGQFLRTGSESKLLKIAPLALVGIIPLSILDDFLIPFIGVADDIPTWLLVLAIGGLTWNRVRRYR